jgi:glutathione reductase (NADPH)
MDTHDYDLFVIGAGSGGVRAARMSAGFGASVAVAEDRYLGGTCVNVGCVPKKLFVYASHFAEEFANARGFGWKLETPSFNWPTLLNNKNKEISRLNGIYQSLLDNTGVTLFEDRATIVDAHTVSVSNQNITAKRILVATGGWPSVPEIPGKEHIITSNEAFFLESLPERMVVVGGGYIAVEFAGIFNGLGVDTSLLYRSSLFLRGFDMEIRQHLAEEMRKKGIKLEFNTNITSIEKADGEFQAKLTDERTLSTDLIMYATGRHPNTQNLGLEQAGVEMNEKNAVIVNEHYQTSIPSIYAIGDVTDRINLTPVATAEGTVLARALYNDQATIVDYADIPTCVFSQPNLGTVGLTEEQAREKYTHIDIYKSTFMPMKFSLSDNDERTFMKLVVDKTTDRVVGVHMLGPEAGEIIQGIGIAIKAGATKAQFDATIGIHPTTAEEFVTMRSAAE